MIEYCLLLYYYIACFNFQTALCPIVDVLLANSSMDPQRKLDELEAVLERLKAISVEVHIFIFH